MSVTLTGSNPINLAGDTGYSLQQLVGALIIEPAAIASAAVGQSIPAYVQLGPLALNVPLTKTAAYTIGVSDTVVLFNGAGSLTATLPTASAWDGRVLVLLTIAAQTVVSASANVVPITGGAAGTAILAATAGKYAVLISNGTNWQIFIAN